MKLNEIQIDRYGVFNNFHLSNLAGEFNLVHGGNGSGKSTLARYIGGVLFGGRSSESGQSGAGHLNVTSNYTNYRLVRSDSAANNLVASVIDGHQTTAAPTSALRGLEATAGSSLSSIFHIDPRDLRQSIESIGRLMSSRFGVAAGSDLSGNDSALAAHIAQETDLKQQLQQIVGQIATLNDQRRSTQQQIESAEIAGRSRISNIDSEIASLTTRLQRNDLHSMREQVDILDAEISALRIKVEQNMNRVQPTHPHTSNDSLAILYRRLDEVDNQIGRWRNIHADVQQQRVQLKDEMTRWNAMSVESNDHPYHRSREILRDIENRINGAESTIENYRSNQDAHNAYRVIDDVQECFEKLRNDLYSLCDELGSQYKNIRHRAAAAELKRLRRCYHEIGENIESLIRHRHSVLEDIRQLDPAGAAAIARADHDFCHCAQHEGYLQARRKFLGDPATTTTSVVHTNQDDGRSRLRELEDLRSTRVRELVAWENESNELQNRLAEQRELREGLSMESTASLRDRLIQLDAKLARAEQDRITIQNRLSSLVPPQRITANPLMQRSSELAQRLTAGEVRKAWWSTDTASTPELQIEQRSGQQIKFEYLGSGLQQQVLLALCLATAEKLRHDGIELPMILDDVFVNLDSELIRQTLDVLTDFSRRGTQVIAMTSDQTVLELCRDRRELVLDLPDTSFTPSVPAWTPDRHSEQPVREPEFLTPFTTRQHVQPPAPPIGYPQVKYPAAGPTIVDHSAASFESGLPVQPATTVVSYDAPAVAPQISTPRFEENLITENSRLEVLRICSSENLNRLSQLGVATLDQLLALNPQQLPTEFANSGVAQADVDRWQAISWLLICVPALQIEDAQILTALGINEPEQLESTHSQQLQDRISRYLNSNEGRQFAEQSRSFSRDKINGWYDSLSRTRSSWRMPSGYSRRNRWSNYNNQRGKRQYSSGPRENRQRDSRSERVSYSMTREKRRPQRKRSHSDDRLDNAVSRFSRQTRDSAPAETRSRTETVKQKRTSSSDRPLKFYLDLSDQLEAAPSIGPKTAERFIAVGVNSVGDFLAQTAESMAGKINYKRITADVIRIWQHQARLVCRIPNLRGHDSQLLVACDITDPEDLAGRSPAQLFGIIGPFAETKEGLKIIRGGKQPDLEEISDWISWAQDTRSLQAA